MQRNPFVDLLRGLSILLVICNHAGVPQRVLDVAPANLSAVIGSGYYGVTVFFVISGYLIATTSIRRFGNLPDIDVKQFIWFRFARIAPLLLLVLALLTSLGRQGAIGFVFSKGDSLSEAVSAVLSLQFNEWFVRHKADANAHAWNVMWSLSIEEMFYLFFPVVCRAARSHAVIVGWLALALPFALYARSHDADAIYAFSGCVDALAIGVLTSLLVERGRERARARPLIAGLVMLGALVTLYRIAATEPPSTSRQWGPLGCALVAAVFIFASTRFPTDLGRAARRAPLKVLAWTLGFPLLLLAYLGQASYEAYLVHLPVWHFVKSYGSPSAASSGVLIVLIGIGSFLLNRGFTEPMNRVVRSGRFVEWLRSERPRWLVPAFAAVALLAVPHLIVSRDVRHAYVVSASIGVARAKLGGATIPLVVSGEPPNADFVSIAQRPDGSVALQYDHWGYRPVVKTVRPDLVKGDFTVTLDCQVPAILVGGERTFGPEDLVGFSGHSGRISIGKNDVGGTTMAATATEEIRSSTLTFDNGATSADRAWKRGE